MVVPGFLDRYKSTIDSWVRSHPIWWSIFIAKTRGVHWTWYVIAFSLFTLTQIPIRIGMENIN